MTESIRSSRKSSRESRRSSIDVSGSSKLSLDYPHEEIDYSMIYSIRDELINSVLDECMQNDFEKSLVKYMVNCAYEAIKRIIELEFNQHDFGKEDFRNDPVWKPDKPPICSPPDTWAASNVPVVTTLDDEEPSLENVQTIETVLPKTFSASLASSKDQTTDQTDVSGPMSLTSVVEQYLVAPNTSEVEIEEYPDDEEEYYIKKEKSLFTTLMTCSTESNPFMQYSSSTKYKDQTQKPQKSVKSMKSLRSATISMSDKKVSRIQTGESKISINSLPPLRAEAQLKIMGSFTKDDVKKQPKKKDDAKGDE